MISRCFRLCRRRAYDVSLSAEIGGPQAHHPAQVDVAGRQDVLADLRVRAATGQSIRRSDTLAGTSCTSLRLHRALQAFRLFLISYKAARICEEDCLESRYAHPHGKIRAKRYRIALQRAPSSCSKTLILIPIIGT